MMQRLPTIRMRGRFSSRRQRQHARDSAFDQDVEHAINRLRYLLDQADP